MERYLILSLVIFLAGCAGDISPGPQSLDEALSQTFRSFESESEDLSVGAEVIAGVLADVDLTSNDLEDRSFSVEALIEEDLADVPHPDRSPDAAPGIVVARRSDFALDAHVGLQQMADQTPIEPGSPDHYDRTFTEGEACFADDGCAALRTTNDVTKKNLLMEVSYTFDKDFRWVETEAGTAMVARSWLPESVWGSGGSILQAYTVEVWIPDGDGTVRMISLWNETELTSVSVSDDLEMTFTRAGMDDVLRAADDWLAEQ